MSWNQYADNLAQTSSGHTTKMQIIGYNRAEYIQASDKQLPVTAGEIMPLIEAHKRKNFESFYQNGPVLMRQKYRFLRQDGDLIMLKCKGVGALTVSFMKTAAIVAYTPEGKQQGITNEAVNKIASYLMTQGF